VGAEAAIGAAYAIGGAGYVLDDWFVLGNAKVDGVLGAAGHDVFVSRPGSGLLYTLVFGLLGGHPLAGLVIATAISAATAVLLYLVAARYVQRPVAISVAAVWIVLPNHTSLEFWQSGIPLAVSVALVLGGALLLARPDPATRDWIGALVLFAAGSLTYEAVAPTAAAIAVFAPLLAGGRLQRRRLLTGAAVFGALGAYLVINRNRVKHIDTDFVRLRQVLPGHFGWGIVRSGTGATVLLALASVGILIALLRLALPGFRPTTGVGERLVAIGLSIMVLGVLPFVAYLYAPLGAGDRFGLVSAIGGALVWVGLGLMCWRLRPLAIAGAAVLLALAMAARVERTDVWTTAAGDSARVVAAIEHRFPDDPPSFIVLGPAPIQEHNVAAFLDQSNVLGMFRYIFGRDVPGGIAYAVGDFESHPPDQRFDLRELSRLHADVDLSSDRQGVPVTPPP
jgi:hypothetical protein